MDSVIHSPPSEPPSGGLDTVDLTSLSLEPAFQGAPKTNNIFAFGTGSTWGTSDTSGTSDTWGMPSASTNAAPFLSLSTGSPWGGVSGLGASSLRNTPLNGEHGSVGE